MPDSVETVSSVLADVRNYLGYLKDMGCHGFSCDKDTLDIINALGREKQPVYNGLADIRRDLRDCTRCRLGDNRKNIVFGDGNENAVLVFVGEGPGNEEDRTGKPFVGAAGQLLTKIIEAMNLTRDAVYICNVVKCRPPDNRNPEPEEVSACLPFLKRQITAIGPDFICALGAVAAQTLLGTQKPISQLRGRFHMLDGMKVMPTYHPSYLLRNPEKKRDVWEDMKLLMKEMGI